MSSLKLESITLDALNDAIENTIASEYEQLNEKFNNIISKIKIRKEKKAKNGS